MSPTNYDIGVRVQALTLSNYRVKPKEIFNWIKVSESSLKRWKRIAKERGFNPLVSSHILAQYVADAPRTGRPTILQETAQKAILKLLKKNSTTRQYSCAELQSKARVNAYPTTVWRFIKRSGYRSIKHTVKPALTKEMRQKRLEFCLKYRDFDWRNVIWTDETSVILGHRRGRMRVWRRPDEKYDIHCIRRRWKGAKEFMFWGCFSYYQKGPCHIWKDETAKEKKAAVKDLAQRNALIEEENKRMWEITSGIRRVGLRNKPGKAPTWKHTKENGAFVRTKGKGGIDWYRYQEVILKKKLLPFAKQHSL